MRKTKHVIALLLAGALAMSACFTGCGQEASKTSEKVNNETTVSSEVTEEAANALGIDEPVTITVLTTRQSTATNSAEDIWFFNYLEYWLGEQGYDVTFDVQQTQEIGQQITMMAGSDSLPDLIWGAGGGKANLLRYGAEEGLLLDWLPYLSEEKTPNLMKLFKATPNCYEESICPVDGGLYGLPRFDMPQYSEPTGNIGTAHNVHINQEWLDAVGKEVPTTLDEFLDVLRAFKNVETASGEPAIPALSNPDAALLEKFLWIGMGYYGSELDRDGLVFSIKDEKVELPAYTDDYRTYVEIMHTMYNEGLISEDYYTLDKNATRGLISAGRAGVTCDYTWNQLPEGWWETEIHANPITVGDNEQILVSSKASYAVGTLWASAKTKYPELLAMIMDYVYSDEGSCYYFYGPMQGQDPLNQVDGWYFDEDGKMTTKTLADGTIQSMNDYVWQYILPNINVGNNTTHFSYAEKLAGRESSTLEHTLVDALTGDEYTYYQTKIYTDDYLEGRFRNLHVETFEPYVTRVTLPAPWMSAEDTVVYQDYYILFKEYIRNATAEFVTGIRPLSELDDYFEELKAMGVEDYIAMARDSYADYMRSVFD